MILITGARGAVGRRVAEVLSRRGVPALALTRNPTANAWPKGIIPLAGDPAELPSLPKLTAVLLSPRACGLATPSLLEKAKAAGATRAVVLSALTIDFELGLPRFREAFRAVEQAVARSGLELTALRSAEYMANTLVWAPQLSRGDAIAGPHAGSRSPLIHEQDIAEVAATALVDGLPGTHVLTGPESLSQRERAEALGRVLERPLVYRELPPDEVRRAVLAQGVPEDVPDRLLGYLGDCLQRPPPVLDTVPRLLGRPALGFDAWCREHAQVFARGAMQVQAGRT